MVSIIGYTNAGKSTLLNALTGSRVLVENRLFATLDPTSRRLRFPKNRAIIITDTVGFIKNLPAELMAAFRATLEELENAKLFLHVIDADGDQVLNLGGEGLDGVRWNPGDLHIFGQTKRALLRLVL